MGGKIKNIIKNKTHNRGIEGETKRRAKTHAKLKQCFKSELIFDKFNISAS